MIVPNKTKQIYLFFLISLLLSACGRSKKIDVSNIPVNVKIERFDKEFYAMNTKPMVQQAAYLQNKYGVFYHDYIAMLLEDNDINTRDTAYFALLRRVFATKDWNVLKHDVDSIYPNVDKPQADLSDAFKHIKYYFPQKKLPAVYTYVSGFATQISIGNNYVGVGIDLFLGGNSRFYPSLTAAWPHYMSRFFDKANIAPRVVEGMAREDMFPESDSNKTLLSKMIYNGKIMYFMDQILPDVSDTTKIGYTTAQLKWCEDFKSDIWAFFLDQNLLYNSDYPTIQKYLTEAPFTPGLGEKNESAPKLAVWTGWQIVRQYMDKHPEVTLPELMADNNAQQILNESKYRPKQEN
ncbi:MAG TPA: gliding motility lipoprotein GldB [Mucilaginibacter sp.]|jgi:gliding motility-associated lipoprotein GldB